MTTTAAAWRHTDEVETAGGADGCRGCVLGFHGPCTTPTPDPASPCGYLFPDDIGCGYPDGDVLHHSPESGLLIGHPHQPTRCFCGHAIEEAK